MSLYGKVKDSAFIRRLNRDLINRVIGEEVGYYKLSLADTVIDFYGESNNKVYYNPVQLTCIIERNPQTNTQESYGSTTDRQMSFAFLKPDLIIANVVPEKGDIILWNESYYEVEIPVEDQLIVGKDPNYAISSSNKYYGMSLSIICECHLTYINRLNIVQSR